MKKICIVLLALFIIILTAIGSVLCSQQEKVSEETASYFRIHIRANSNSEEDQGVKYLVRDAVVEAMSGFLCECHSLNQAEECVQQNISIIETTANQVLRQNGFNYTSRGIVHEEEFPTRTYEGHTLEAGIYEALILELGTGEGDNWWCVIYPPLCFATTEKNIVYRSKLWEIIQEFYQ